MAYQIEGQPVSAAAFRKWLEKQGRPVPQHLKDETEDVELPSAEPQPVEPAEVAGSSDAEGHDERETPDEESVEETGED